MKVILHILSDLSGKIDGPMFSNLAIAPASKAYGEIRKKLNCQGVVYGLTTMAEGYCDGLSQVQRGPDLEVFEDHQAETTTESFIVSLDPQGTLFFEKGELVRKNRASAHVIQVLTGAVSQNYLDELQEHGVSWIYAGKTAIDLPLVVHKLEKDWGITRLMVAGGGICDWAFARENLLDELSIVLAPIASADETSASVFRSMDKSEDLSVAYTLKEAEIQEGGALWLHYAKRAQ